MLDTRESILASIRARQHQLEEDSRELVPAEPTIFSPRPREVYKEEKNKRSNYVSRDHCEETASSKVSDETCPLACQPVAQGTSSSSLEEDSFSQEVVDNNITPASSSSRTFSGLSAQHNRSTKGIKVSLTLQKADEATSGEVIKLTAELKRSDRIRELKPYEDDSDFFATLYASVKQAIKSDEDKEFKKRVCLGRLHERGSRSAWVADMAVFGELDADNKLKRIIFYYNDESYQIPMNGQLSPRQAESYYCCGLLGNLVNSKRAPTLATLKRTPFNP